MTDSRLALAILALARLRTELQHQIAAEQPDLCAYVLRQLAVIERALQTPDPPRIH